MNKAYISALLLKIILPLLLYESLFYAMAIALKLPPDALNDGRTALPLQTAAAAVSILILGSHYRKEMRESGPAVSDLPGAWDCFRLLALGVLSAAGGNLLLNLTRLPENSASFQTVIDKMSGTSVILQLTGMVILIPLCEELIYRGMAFRYLRENMTLMKAAALSSLLFAVMHGNPVQGIYAFFVGMILSLVYEKYRRIIIVYLVHAIANLTAIVLPVVIPENIQRLPVLAAGLACTAVSVFILHFIVKGR